MLQHAREIAPSVSWEILVRVKRSGGMSVNELAAELKMSYMGVKQHCDDLRKKGYVDTWRRPKGTGRPEKIYRPAPRLDTVLPSWGTELCLGVLAHAAQAYGESAPERLLYSYLQQKVDRWGARLKGKTPKDRLAELVKMRTADGWMCELRHDEHGLRLHDYHSPLAEVARLYPTVWEMETRALAKLFALPVERTMDGYRSELTFITGETPPASAATPPAAPAIAPASAPEPEPEPAAIAAEAPPATEPTLPPVLEVAPAAEPAVWAAPTLAPTPEPVPEPAPAAPVPEPAPAAPVPEPAPAAPVPEPAPAAPVPEPVPATPVPEPVPAAPVPEPAPAAPVPEPVPAAPVPEPAPAAPVPGPGLFPEAPVPPAPPKTKSRPAPPPKGQPVQADLFDF